MSMTGSLQNRMLEKMKKPVVVVGMGATELCYSDRHPYTVVTVISQNEVIVQEDDHKVVKGNAHDGTAVYEYIANPDAYLKKLTYRKDGRWHEGTTLKGQVFAVGYRNYYYDPSF